MKRSSVPVHFKIRRGSLNRSASAGLVSHLNVTCNKKLTVAALIAASKIYGKNKPFAKNDKIIQRFCDSGSNINTDKLLGYLGKPEPHEKGKALSDDAIKRIYQNFADEDKKLSFEYIMKIGQHSGVTITAKMAKAIVRRYGQRKDHLDLTDCLRINERRKQRSTSKNSNAKRL